MWRKAAIWARAFALLWPNTRLQNCWEFTPTSLGLFHPTSRALQCGDPPPSSLSPDERRAYEQLTVLFGKRRAYAQMMATRPQTLYGLADSPVCLAAGSLTTVMVMASQRRRSPRQCSGARLMDTPQVT